MADIFPFRALYFAQETLDDVVAPPYDVISPTEQNALYEKNPRNVVRLILGREENWYAHAAQLFEAWQKDGTLTADDSPAFYVYRQRFFDPITKQPVPERVGLVCLLRLEEYASGKVLPHENTLTKARADRLNLLRATEANFESIFGLYNDPDGSVQSFLAEYADRETPILQVADAIGSSHAIERVADENAVSLLQTLLVDKPIFIADGHHRYETALQYRRELGAISPDHPANFILVTLTAFEDAGLLVLPTHRLVRGVEPSKIESLTQTLGPEFRKEAWPESGQIEDNAIGIVTENGTRVQAILTGPAEQFIDGEHSEAWKRLDVTKLHALILEKRLGIGADALASGEQVAYTRDAQDAARRVETGEFQAAFLLVRPIAAEVEAVSRAGEKMPQKSTYFYPKLLSGLLLRDFKEG